MDKIISPLIAKQFPEIYRTDGPNLVAFMQAYYEWMEQEGNVNYLIRSIADYTDIDNTLDSFLSYFTDTYLNGLPANILSDKRLLVKHINEFYKAKGSFRATQLLFRMVFNEDVDINIPSESILKASDGTWVVPQYIEVSDSPYLEQLVGTKITGTTTNANAIVEQYVIKNINNRLINVLILSNINGKFAYGELVLSDDISGMNVSLAPIIFGSLSTVSIVQGGANYNVGDVLSVNGTGSGAKAIVTSTLTQNGKVSFQLLNGGFGYSANAVISVTGGGGSGATFSIGGLLDKQVYYLNSDIANTYNGTQLEIPSYGYILYYTGLSGTFSIGETVNSSANVVGLDVKYVSGNTIVSGETLSNTTLSIAGLTVDESQGSYILVSGNNTSLAKIDPLPHTGITLVSSNNNVITINSTIAKTTLVANGIVTATNSTSVSLNTTNGHFVNNISISGATSGAIATITSSNRQTNWGFPAVNIPDIENLDTQIQNALTFTTMIIGKISYLNNINPGIGYSSSPTVSIVDTAISPLMISDGSGGFWGSDAVVSATANSASGIIGGVQVIDSGFGYQPNEIVSLTSNNVTSVSGVAVVDLNGVSAGYYKDNKGILSSTNYLQDSDYYQAYSYELIAPRMLSTYQQLVEDFVHPCGMKLFGKYSLRDMELNSTSALVDNEINTSVGVANTSVTYAANGVNFTVTYNSGYVPVFTFGL